MQLLVDPVVLVIPDEPHTEDSVVDFLLHLADWNEVLRSTPHQLFLSDACIEAMTESNCFPDFQMFQRLCRQHNIVHIDPKTAFNACRRIFEHAPRFEERAQLAEVIEVYTDRVIVEPDLLSRHKEPIATKMRETLALLAYIRERAEEAVSDFGLVSHPLAGSDIAAIRAQIETIAGTLDLSSEVPLVCSSEQLRCIVGLEGIWQDTAQAIEWALEDLGRRGVRLAGATVASYAVGGEFNRSIKDRRYHTRVADLRRIFCEISRLLTGQISAQSSGTNHELRNITCNAVDAEGRVWEPWRLWITEGTAAVRLHYWRHKGKFILSRVAAHEDMRIDPVRAPLSLTAPRVISLR